MNFDEGRESNSLLFHFRILVYNRPKIISPQHDYECANLKKYSIRSNFKIYVYL